MKVTRNREVAALLALSLLCVVGLFALIFTMDRTRHWNGPTGKVTQKMWVQEFWQAGEQLYPARWCLELNYRDEICIPENDWNKISIGDWYGEK